MDLHGKFEWILFAAFKSLEPQYRIERIIRRVLIAVEVESEKVFETKYPGLVQQLLIISRSEDLKEHYNEQLILLDIENPKDRRVPRWIANAYYLCLELCKGSTEKYNILREVIGHNGSLEHFLEECQIWYNFNLPSVSANMERNEWAKVLRKDLKRILITNPGSKIRKKLLRAGQDSEKNFMDLNEDDFFSLLMEKFLEQNTKRALDVQEVLFDAVNVTTLKNIVENRLNSEIDSPFEKIIHFLSGAPDLPLRDQIARLEIELGIEPDLPKTGKNR